MSSKPRHAPPMYCLPSDQPVVVLDAKTAFQGLTDKERLYAHHLSRASYFGGLVVLLQTSQESPQIYRLIQAVNSAEDVEDLRKSALAGGASQDDFQAFLVFCSGVFTNMGNYKGFGDSKFIPDLTGEAFKKIIESSLAFNKNPQAVTALWNSIEGPVFSLNDKVNQLGIGEKGITKYFSANCDLKDSDLVNRFFRANKLEGYNNRVVKVEKDGKNLFEIRHAASDGSVLKGKKEFEGCDFLVTAGDYDKLLGKVNEELSLAAKYAANDNEKAMVDKYVESFKSGSLDAHKDGSRFWIKNKGPAVETYIGFIETYRDPVGMRGEFEGFVAMVNRDQSAKFQELVDKAEMLIPRLPWPKEFEKDTFLRPDFTSLDVLTFAGSGIPAGINIPNYDEIRQSEGFKNVNLGNVIATSYKTNKDEKTSFISQADHELLEKYGVGAFELQVGLHELLGHGSGKLLIKDSAGKFNFPKGLSNPVDGKPVDKWYEDGETYDSKFTSMGSSYEECRAECVGLYLSCDQEALKIFGHTDPQTASDVLYINWLELCLRAIKGLEMYSTGSGEWKQAHSQARFVILNVLLQAGDAFVRVEQVKGDDGTPDLLLTMDRSKIELVGKPAMGDFLQKLQVFKSTGDVASAEKMFMSLSAVNDDSPSLPWAAWRDIAIARKKPRKMMVQANTVLKDGKVAIQDYAPSHEGMMRSWRERFTPAEHEEIDKALEELHLKDKPHF